MTTTSRTGRRPLAITAGARNDELPNVPIMQEARVGGMELYEWNAMFAPAGTLPAIVDRLAPPGARPFAGSRADGARFVQAEVTRLGQVVRDRHIIAE